MKEDELVDKILKEINYVSGKFGGKYDAITIPELIELAVNRTQEYFIVEYLRKKSEDGE